MLDPNVIYFVLLLGLWVAITAFYVPGTWIPETIAAVLLVGSILALTLLPTNWIAVFSLVIGTGAFLVLPMIGGKFGQFAEVGLILQALGAWFLFDNHDVSLWLIAISLIFSVLYHRLVLIPVLRSVRDQDHTPVYQNIIGKYGRVQSEIRPVGTVYVDKEQWRARSDEHLLVGTMIIVIEQDGLELIVRKAKRDDHFDDAEALSDETA